MLIATEGVAVAFVLALLFCLETRGRPIGPCSPSRGRPEDDRGGCNDHAGCSTKVSCGASCPRMTGTCIWAEHVLRLADAPFFETSFTAHLGGCPSAAATRKSM